MQHNQEDGHSAMTHSWMPRSLPHPIDRSASGPHARFWQDLAVLIAKPGVAGRTPAYAGYLVAGDLFARRLKPASCNSPCYLFVKPGLLAAYIRLTSTFQGQLSDRQEPSPDSFRPND